MKVKSVCVALAAAGSLSAVSTASGQDIESDTQLWNAIAVAGPVKENSRLLLWFDGHARFRDNTTDLGVTIIRPALGWRVNPNLDVWAGYARVVSRGEDRPDIEENRFWQQATYPLPELLGGRLGGRSRLEQRFRETGNDTGWRFRQFVRWERPIGESDISVVLWDELFLNLNDADWGQDGGFDQNRLFVGAAWHLTDSARIETGYLNNILNIPGATEDQMNHNVSLTLFWNL
ncbi:MAG: DUF2490 domain-containing protein [Pseudomonadota bacterium]